MANTTNKIFSAGPVELWQVIGASRTKLKDGPLEVYSLNPTQAYPMLSAVLQVDGTQWHLTLGSHTMRSLSEAGEPTFIFSQIFENDVDTFYCVIFKRGHAAHELEVLEQVLSKLSVLHVSKNVKNNALPFNLALPQIDPKCINELMRKGAQDTQLLLKQAGDAANQAFLAAAEMHKKYAPKPAEKPVEVNPDVRDKIVKTKQAAAAGAAVAKGVATGMQAATAEIGGTLVQTVSSAAAGATSKKDGKGDGSSSSSSSTGGQKVPQPLAAVGGVGMELLRDIAAVRDAMLDAAGNAWQGARQATVDVMHYQYGEQVAAITAESCDAVEGIASMGVAMKYAQPSQVVLTSAKETSSKVEGKAATLEGEALKQQLEEERAALERERAALAAEKARMQGGQQQQQRKPAFGLPFAFA